MDRANIEPATVRTPAHRDRVGDPADEGPSGPSFRNAIKYDAPGCSTTLPT